MRPSGSAPAEGAVVPAGLAPGGRVETVPSVDDPRRRPPDRRARVGSSATYSGHSVSSSTTSAPRTASETFSTQFSSGHFLRALSSACGSVTETSAPWSCIWAATLSAGESRTSSLSGLNAAPSTATRRPTIDPPQTSRARSTMRTRRRMLIASTSRRKLSAWSTPSSPARAMKARMSLGRQPPPKPSPALRNFRPIRASCPIASASTVTSAPVASHSSAMALMNEILVARNELAATLTSWAVARSALIRGVPSASATA